MSGAAGAGPSILIPPPPPPSLPVDPELSADEIAEKKAKLDQDPTA
jgi:hypothetical protein